MADYRLARIACLHFQLQKQQHLPYLDYSSSHLQRSYRHNMAQPNIQNFNAAIASISQAANDITLKVQDFNTHQPALGNELLLFANAPVAQIQQQLTDILAAINQSNLLNSARYTSRPTDPILYTDLRRDWNINAKMENSKVYQPEGLFIALRQCRRCNQCSHCVEPADTWFPRHSCRPGSIK